MMWRCMGILRLRSAEWNRNRVVNPRMVNPVGHARTRGGGLSFVGEQGVIEWRSWKRWARSRLQGDIREGHAPRSVAMNLCHEKEIYNFGSILPILRVHCDPYPPSTAKPAPCMKLLIGEARKTMASVTSSIIPNRLSGVLSRSRSRYESGGTPEVLSIGVSI